MSQSSTIIRVLESVRDRQKAIQMKAYMKDRYEFYGVSAPVRKEVLRPVLSLYRKIDKETAIDDILQLWNEPARECQYAAMVILDRYTKKLNPSDVDFIQHLIESKSWWDTVDHLAGRQVGHIFKDKDVRSLKIDLWLGSEDIWLNRSCLLYQLFYKEDTDWEALKSYIEKLKVKKEFFIQKAIGWAIRQYSKTNPGAAREFLDTKELSGLAQREGMKWIQRQEG